MTAFNLVWASPATILTSLSFKPVFLRKSGQICVSESAGVIATVLPIMSCGVRMFLSANPITDIAVVWLSTPTAMIGAPLIAARIMVVTSA
jgi:hypothetical protein